MTTRAIYQSILDQKLYTFHADDPEHVVRSQIRRHCVGLDFASASRKKAFSALGDGTYWLAHAASDPKPVRAVGTRLDDDSLSRLKDLYTHYLTDTKAWILKQLRALDPITFERFSQKLLEIYGFRDVKVTKKGPDGGIDGYGRLIAGLGYLSVAFQCKNWRHRQVPRTEIDRFRGASQGKYEQGIFFTTATFSPGAKKAQSQPGAIPIVLIDGQTLVDLMLEKGFGVEVEVLPIYSYALDLVIADLSSGELRDNSSSRRKAGARTHAI